MAHWSEDGGHAASSPSVGGSGVGLPVGVRAKMELAFGADFSAVRIHQGSQAQSLGAHAYAQGTDIYFAPGQYDPHSQSGQELLGHELAHVVQQAERRVQSAVHAKGMQVNDDPALEREADELGARAARGEVAVAGRRTLQPLRSGGGAPAQPDPRAEEAAESHQGTTTDPGAETLSLCVEAASFAQVQEGAGPVQARGLQPIQRRPDGGDKGRYIRFQINVTRTLTAEEFKVVAMRQLFGSLINHVQWYRLSDSYTPDNSPYTLDVDESLLKLGRGEISRSRGIETTQDGSIIGARSREKTFSATSNPAEKVAMLAEINRRYNEAAGKPRDFKIPAGQLGRDELWSTIRDEILFQREYLGNMPPKVKELIKFSLQGKELTLADYDQLFRIAKKIENMPLGQVGDYLSKITASTTDLNLFEAALEKYSSEMAQRENQADEREKIQTKLLGMEEVYKTFRQYRSALMVDAYSSGMSMGMGSPGPVFIGPSASGMIRTELEEQLRRHGFASITEFEDFIKKFENTFELTAANIAQDLLTKYAGKLYKESARYKNPTEVSNLYRQLHGFRTQQQESQRNSTIVAEYIQSSMPRRFPGYGDLQPKVGFAEAEAANKKAEASKQAAQGEIHKIASEHPIFQEESLPQDKRIDQASLANASESDLGSLLQSSISNRMKDIEEARAQLEDKPELIYKMDKLIPQFYLQQGIAPGSIYDLIIQDKLKDDAVIKLVTGIVLAVVAIALAFVSMGSATPAILAAGASIGGFGLSAYMAYEEYKGYTEQEDLADVGFADDPSVVWLVIAVIGVAIDMGAAVKAMKALGPAAKVLEGGGDLKEFIKAVRALEKAHEIDAKIAQSVEKAAAAQKGFAEATTELSEALAGKLYSFPGPFTDPDVYRALARMAREGIKGKFHDFQKFIEELKLARINAKLAEMTPEELAKAKEAWEQAKLLEHSAKESVDIIGDSGRTIGKYSQGSHLEIIPARAKDKLHGGNTIHLNPDATTTVTGTLDDVNKVAVRGERLPGATQMGENSGGINILRSPKWSEIKAKHIEMLKSGDTNGYWKLVTDEFWQTTNKPWLDEAIGRGDTFRFVSDPGSEAALYVTDDAGKFILDNGSKIRSIFGREVDYLTSKGYTFSPDGTAVKVN